MKKFLSILLLSIMFISSIYSGGVVEEPRMEVEHELAEPTVIRIWTLDRHDASFWLERIAEYNRTNKHGIKVEYEIYTDNYWSAVDMAFRAGNAPDILRYDPALDKYLFQDKFADMIPFMSEEEKDLTREGWYDGINYIDGKLYCIFTGSGFARLFFNQSLLDEMGLEPPRTMEELIENARIITEKRSDEGIYGFACNLDDAKQGLKRSFEPMVELGTGIRFGYDFGRGVYDFKPYVPYLEAWKELMKYALPGCTSLGIDLLRRHFASGRIGMYMSYAQAEPGVYDFQFPMADGESYGCAALPVIGGEKNGHQGGGGTPAYYLNRESGNLEKAWLAYSEIFLDFDNLVDRFENNLGISNLTQVIEKAELSEKYRRYKALLLDPEYDVIYPKTPEEKYPDDFVIDGMDMFEVFSGIITGKIDMDEGIADITRRYNDVNERLVSEGHERIVDPAFAR